MASLSCAYDLVPADRAEPGREKWPGPARPGPLYRMTFVLHYYITLHYVMLHYIPAGHGKARQGTSRHAIAQHGTARHGRVSAILKSSYCVFGTCSYLFVSSDILKCRLLKGLLDHSMTTIADFYFNAEITIRNILQALQT